MIIGIDPGTYGAVALIGETGDLASIARIRNGDYTDVVELLTQYENDIEAVYMELVNSCQGKQQSFIFGKHNGIMIGLLMMVGFTEDSINFISSVKWQSKAGCRCGGDKKKHQARAVELFPNWKKEIMQCLDVSDVPLIAYYGYLDYYK